MAATLTGKASNAGGIDTSKTQSTLPQNAASKPAIPGVEVIALIPLQHADIPPGLPSLLSLGGQFWHSAVGAAFFATCAAKTESAQ